MSDAPSQTDLAVDMIRSKIIDLTLAPGSRIDEPLILTEFGLGRTPAREAINRLAAEGFVSIASNRGGMYVRSLDLQDMLEIVRAHQVVETVLGNMISFDDPLLVPDLRRIQADYVQDVRAHDYLRITATNQCFHLRMHETVRNTFVYGFARSTHQHVRRLNVQIYKLESVTPVEHEARLAANMLEHDRIIDAVEARDGATLSVLLNDHARTGQDRLARVLEEARVDPFSMEPSPWKGGLLTERA